MSSSTGNLPNAGFRAIPSDHLADHPDFVSLPDQEYLQAYSPRTYSELRLFSQDSSEWDFLHADRLTTSRCAAFLGFYESKSADVLSIPNGLRGHSKALHAVLHLRGQGRKDSLQRTAADILIAKERSESAHKPRQTNQYTYLASIAGLRHITFADVCAQDSASFDEWKRAGSPSRGLWRPTPPKSNVFPSTYHPAAPLYEYFVNHSRSVRMAFGSVQESTAVLAALNVLVQRARVKMLDDALNEDTKKVALESIKPKRILVPSSVVGRKTKTKVQPQTTTLLPQLPVEMHLPQPSPSEIPLPDSVTFTPPSTPTPTRPVPPRVLQIGICLLEALDSTSSSSSSSSSSSLSSLFPPPALPPLLPLIGASPDGVFVNSDGTVACIEVKCHSPFLDAGRGPIRINDRGPQAFVGAWHIPQLMLEVLCLGPLCTGTYFVSMSATKGCNVFFVKRDDKYILELLRLVSILYSKFVLNEESSRMPPPNFGQTEFSKEEDDYPQFLEWTKRIAQSAELIEAVSESNVQRSPHHDHLFFDSLIKSCRREGNKLFYR